MMRTYWWISVAVFWLLLIIINYRETRVQAQQANLAEAIQTVVRIRGCNVAGCNVGLGSGVVIHSSGVILTANHVTLTDPRNPLSPRLEDFVIEITGNARQAPQARYRARLLAAKPEADLALLGIYWDEVTNQAAENPAAVNLPTLPIADVNTIELSDRLHILGYPLAGGAAINYTEAALGGFDENGALLKVNASLNEGYSGGPVLVEQNGRYAIAGIVILRRADVSFIRNINQLGGLIWEATANRVWADNVQVTIQGNESNSILQVRADIHALDYVNHKGRFLAYVFDANTRQPWSLGESKGVSNANNQLVLYVDFSATQTIDVLRNTTVTLSLNHLNLQANQFVVRLVLWNIDETRALWRDIQWYYPQAGNKEATIALTPTSTFIQQTPTFSATLIPLSTLTNTPEPTTTTLPVQQPTNTPSISSIRGQPCSKITVGEQDGRPDLQGCTLRIAVENSYQPFSYIDPGTKQAVGYDYDIFAEICKRINCQTEFVETSWDAMVAIMGGQSELKAFDIGADGITITVERARSVDFSIPYITAMQMLLVRADESRFTEPDEFVAQADLKLGTQLGTTNYDAAAELVGEDRLVAFDQLGSAVQALMAGYFDALLIDNISGLDYVKANRNKLKLIDKPVRTEELGFIFGKGSPLKAPIDAAIKAMRDDGKLDELFEKWFTIE